MVSVLRPLPDRLAGLGVIIAGVAWSGGTTAARWSSVEVAGFPVIQAIALIALGGMAAVFAAWFGFGSVVWAMTRLLRAEAGFMRVLLAVSAAAWPLWLAAPAAAILLSQHGTTALRTLVGALLAGLLLLFAAQLTASLRTAAAMSNSAAWACVALASMFCGSFLSLEQ
ncbi:MAG: hypothetical protein K2X43_02145 [Hyphomonadaceae bacterium]|nr:hypothetical protein [Hyphomonadaceae bacterium]